MVMRPVSVSQPSPQKQLRAARTHFLHLGSNGQEETMERARDAAYSWTTRLPKLSMGDARAKVTELLKAQGFGVLTEIDVKATLKQKLDVDVAPYQILGACNPQLARRALEEDRGVGLLLPCNVCLWQEDGVTVVAIADPRAMFRMVENPRLEPIMEEAERRLHAVADELRR
jgi:uncharacterized protein (DUF302 family)